MTRRRSAILFFVFLAMLFLPGNLAAAEAGAIRIQGPPAVGLLPLLWLEEEGLLDAVDLEIFISQDHQRGIALVASGDLDFLVTGVNVGAKAYNRGVDLQLVNTNTWGIDYLLTAGFAPEGWADLEGRTLCLPLQGGPLDFLARYLLVQNGAEPGRVEFIYLPSNNGARTFQLGRVDAIILPEPLVTITLNSFPEAHLSFDMQKEWGKLHGDERIPFVGLFVRGSFAREQPELTAQIARLYREGVEWVQAHPLEASALAERHFGQNAAIFRQSLDRIHFQVYPREEARDLIELFFGEIMDFFPEMIGGQLPDDSFYF